jgi:hypothetical protein
VVFASYDELLLELLYDTERQLEEFSHLVPFKYNKDVYSPRLVNLLLTTCTQIETLCELLVPELQLPGKQGDGIKDVIRQIDTNGILSKMNIYSKKLDEKFRPFANGTYDWWTKNNKVKHELLVKGRAIKYHTVVDGIAALVCLHRLSNAMHNSKSFTASEMLDSQNWYESKLRFKTIMFRIEMSYYTRNAPEAV